MSTSQKNQKHFMLTISEIRSHISSFTSKSQITDIGCGIPTLLFDLQIQFGFRNFIGFDIEESEKALFSSNTQCRDVNAKLFMKSIKDYHSYYLRKYGASYLNDNKISNYISSYNNDYSFRLDFDISREIITDLPQTDFLILNNVLHFLKFSEVKNIISEIHNVLSDNALIIISINHTENSNVTDSSKSIKIGRRSYKALNSNMIMHLVDTKGFEELISILERNGISSVIRKIRRNKNNSGIQSLLYVGKKVMN